jgi:alkaline phosphatase D
LENGLLVDAADYHRSWRYLHDDAGFAALLAATSYVATWDDHECVNNFGPDDSWGLLADARQAMFAWNPLWGTADEPERLYRSIRWGRHLELFVLDTRSYRALTDLADDQTEPKSMLGKSQRDWLLAALAASDATWRVIVSSVPLTAPTGDAFKGRDGWSNDGSATGYERELLDLLRGMQQLGIRQPLFLVADVHHAEVLSLQPFADDPGFRPLEIVVGPMNAGCFGRERLDPTLRPTTLFYLGPDHDPRTRAEVLGLWNFGLLTVAADGSLQLAIVDANGAERFQLALQP